MRIVTLTETDRDREVALDLGDQLVVTLGESPTTGYVWDLQGAGGSLQLVDDQFAQAGHAEQPGAGGTRTFVMRADAEGVSDVQLKLWRPWGGDASVERRLGFRVTVNR